MNKENLKKYFHNYGETKFLDDLSSILSEMKDEWEGVDENVSNSFSSSSSLISEAAGILERSEKKYQSNGDMSPASAEFIEIQKFFSGMNLREFKKYYESQSAEFNNKLLRLKELKDIIDDDKPKK